MTPSREAATDESSTEDDAASQTTEDDPQIPESQLHAVAAAVAAATTPPTQPPHPHPHPSLPAAAPPPPPSLVPAPSTNPPQARARPRYELKHTLSGHTMSISSVKFSPDGALLASCGNVPLPVSHAIAYAPPLGKAADNVAKIWSPFSGELIRNLNGHTKGLSDIAWSPDGASLATASDDHTIRIWDVDSVCTILRHAMKSDSVLNCRRGRA
jgi:COMPASS component SWD3